MNTIESIERVDIVHMNLFLPDAFWEKLKLAAARKVCIFCPFRRLKHLMLLSVLLYYMIR